MPNPSPTARIVLAEAASNWIKHSGWQLGAALAFYAILSLAPLLVIALAIGSALFGEQTASEHLLAQLKDLVGSDAGQAINDLLQNAPRPGAKTWAAGLSIVVLLLGASGVFSSLQAALYAIWEVPPQPRSGLWSLVISQSLSVVMVLCIGGLLVFSLTLSATISSLGEFAEGSLPRLTPLLHSCDALATFLVVAGLFALIFKLLPPVRVAWRDVALGAFLTAALFTGGKLLIGIYLGTSGIRSAYGAAGSLMVLVVWIYYSSLLLLFGAELTRAFAQQSDSQAERADSAGD